VYRKMHFEGYIQQHFRKRFRRPVLRYSLFDKALSYGKRANSLRYSLQRSVAW